MNSKDLVRKQKSGQDISADMKTIANQKPTLQNTAAVKPSVGVSNPNSNAKILTRMNKNGQNIAPSMKLASHGSQLSPYSVKKPVTVPPGGSGDKLWDLAWEMANKKYDDEKNRTPINTGNKSSGDPLWDLAWEMTNKKYDDEKKRAPTNTKVPSSGDPLWDLAQEVAFSSPYTKKINNTINKIENRAPFEFSYDVTGDALYQQYKDAYTRNAGQSMNDTLGKTAALTGGYGNSYAAAAAQQSYDYQMDKLNDKVPELYQAAYDRAYNQYSDETNNMYRQLSAYNDLDNTSYSRYRDTVADGQWQKTFDEDKRRYDQDFTEDKRRNDRDFAEDTRRYDQDFAENIRQYDNSLAENQRQYDTNFAEDKRRYDTNLEYQKDRDKVSDSQWEQTFGYQKDRDKVGDSQWQQTFDYQKDRDSVSDAQWQEEQDWVKKVYGDEKEQKDREYDLAVRELAIDIARNNAGGSSGSKSTKTNYSMSESKDLAEHLEAITSKYNEATTEEERLNLAQRMWEFIENSVDDIDMNKRQDIFETYIPASKYIYVGPEGGPYTIQLAPDTSDRVTAKDLVRQMKNFKSATN